MPYRIHIEGQTERGTWFKREGVYDNVFSTICFLQRDIRYIDEYVNYVDFSLWPQEKDKELNLLDLGEILIIESLDTNTSRLITYTITCCTKVKRETVFIG